MRNKILFTVLILIVVIVASCSDDFLENNNQDLYTLSDTLYLNNSSEAIEASISMPGIVNAGYTVFMQPRWLSFSSMHGKITNGEVVFSVSVVDGYFSGGYQVYYGTIILNVENIGMVSFHVACSDYGSPVINCSISSLDFESSGTQVFTIRNTSDGILKWRIAGIPEWLIFSPVSGSLNNGGSTLVMATLDYDHITSGQEISGMIQIQSNSVTGNLTIPVHVSAEAVIPPEVRQIEGNVTDAEFSRGTGIMAICTKSPNSLIVFNTGTGVVNTLALEKSPSCLSLSDDGKKAVIGYTVSSVSYIDIETLQIIREYPIDCIPFDIIYGNNGWSYITPTVDQWVNFRNLNLSTGDLIQNSGFMIYEKTLIKKVPGKPYLVGTRTNVSPSGILIFDVTKGRAADTITYYHTSIGRFWLSTDATRIYDSNKYIYSLPDHDGGYHISAPPVFGQFESDQYNVAALDDCPAINSIFVTFTYNYAENSSQIEQFNATSLNKIRTLSVSPVFLNENGTNILYETSPRYIFTNNEGSTIFVIKNLRESYNKDYWTIEILDL